MEEDVEYCQPDVHAWQRELQDALNHQYRVALPQRGNRVQNRWFYVLVHQEQHEAQVHYELNDSPQQPPRADALGLGVLHLHA